jgi:menaquinone-dependent protoporphyrinogen IX oxidase
MWNIFRSFIMKYRQILATKKFYFYSANFKKNSTLELKHS